MLGPGLLSDSQGHSTDQCARCWTIRQVRTIGDIRWQEMGLGSSRLWWRKISTCSSAWKKLRQGSMEFCVAEWMYRYPSNHFKVHCVISAKSLRSVRRVTQSLHVDVLNLLRMWITDHGFRKKFSDQPPEKINQLNFFGPRIKAQRFPFSMFNFCQG